MEPGTARVPLAGLIGHCPYGSGVVESADDINWIMEFALINAGRRSFASKLVAGKDMEAVVSTATVLVRPGVAEVSDSKTGGDAGSAKS